MMYPDVTSALAADRIHRYRAEADAWRVVHFARAARAARRAERRSRPSSRAAPARAAEATRRPAHSKG
jgi:hypothetical protein